MVKKMEPYECKGVVFGVGKPKICVPLVEKTDDALVERAGAIRGLPFDLLEWRTDHWNGKWEEGRLVEALSALKDKIDGKPLLFTYRTKTEGGLGDCEEVAPYFERVRQAVETGLVDLVDVEYRMCRRGIADVLGKGRRCVEGFWKAARGKGVGIVVSYHNFDATPSSKDMVRIVEDMQNIGADMTKVAVTPRRERDVLTLWDATLALREGRADRPFITMAMGGMGVLTRLSGGTFGSAMTFASAGRVSAPGQMDAEEVNGILDALRRAAVDDAEERNAAGHIFLIGFMGVGKSGVAEELGLRLGLPVKDADACIVAEEGRAIAEIFQDEGEEYFRDVETAWLKGLGSAPPAIVSCGGGMALREENVREMKGQGTVVHLTATPETVYDRIKDDGGRPVLKGNMNVAYIRTLMGAREAYYEAAADVTVATDGKAISEVADEVADEVAARLQL